MAFGRVYFALFENTFLAKVVCICLKYTKKLTNSLITANLLITSLFY